MKTILLVEDQPLQRRLLYHALKSDYRVLEASDRRTALECLEREPVDLVVLDLHLPPDPGTAQEGLLLHEAIREMARPVPVVVVTSDTDPRLPDELARRGVAGFLRKPLLPDTLKGLISQSLEGDD